MNLRLELVQNPKNNSILSKAYLCLLTRKFQEKNRKTGKEIENPLADLGISLEKKCSFLDLEECRVKLARCFLFAGYRVSYCSISLGIKSLFES